MIEVEFLGPINKESMKLDINNLSQLSVILKKEEEFSKWLDICAVAINDKLISKKDIELNNGDKISLLPPICGG